MTFSKLMDALNERAIRLQRDGGDLIILGGEETLTPSLLSELSAHKVELLNLLDRNNGDWLSPGFIITPEMLPLVELTQAEIDAIVAGVPGGAANVQDIYPLTALQEGILFHHLMSTRGDVYLLHTLLAFDTRERLEGVLRALREVIARHDILRTAVVWEGLREPAQVVWREAPLSVEEVALDTSEGDVADRLRARFDPRHTRLDLSQAPLMRCVVTHDAANGRWLLLWLCHHLTSDHTTVEMIIQEAQASLLGEIDQAPKPLPFRNFVAQARLGKERAGDEAFFREMLGDVEEPTAPFGLLEAQGDGSEIEEARMELEAILAKRLRERARAMKVGAASLCHLAWAQVLARVSGREDVVFGTVLFGRTGGREGADRVLGMLINTLPIRIRVGAASVEESVRQTHKLLTELLKHEHASLALAQRCSAVAAPTPLFSALLNYRHSPQEAEPGPETALAWAGVEILDAGERTNYPLTLTVDDLGDVFCLKAQAVTPIDPGRICAFMRKALDGLVEALDTEPETKARDIDVMPGIERQQVLEEWNATEAEYPKEKLVQELFEEQVEKSPEAVALEYEEQLLTYEELNRRANRLGHYLRGLGVGPEALVGIYVERSLEMVIGLLGIFKAGGAYVPLDPAYPTERLRFMLDDGNPLVVLTTERLLGELPAFAGVRMCLDRDWSLMIGQNEENPPRQVTGENMAYIIYTSGSTGQPKGVMGLHGGVINRFVWMWRTYPFTTDEVACQKTSLSFGDSVWEVFGPLLQGVRTVIIEDEIVKDSNRLARMLEAGQVSRIVLVPSLLRALIDSSDDLPGGVRRLKYCISSGEALSSELSEAFSRRLPESGLLNLYGSSEVSADVTWHDVGNGEVNPCVSIGRPIANTQIYLLDNQFQPVPAGVQGELFIGGAGLARGYLNQAGLTAEKFTPDPYRGDPGRRLYKTGDLGRYLAHGEIEFLGRIDHQVKVRGYRIELGEIEARLAERTEVNEAVVVAREEGGGGNRLVAYYTGEEVGAEALRGHLSSSLPEYMIPAAYVHLESLPLTPSGKLDRRALPAPDGKAYVRRGYEPPLGEIETILARIWAELLKVEKVGRWDNFFEIGGHSLLATQVASRVRNAFGAAIEVRSVFDEPTVAGLSRRVEAAMRSGERDVAPPLVRGPRGGAAPLSFAQRRLWFLDQLVPNEPFYNLSGAVRLRGRLDLKALERAIDEIVRRHEVLRTRIEAVGGEPAQIVEAWEPRRLEVVNLSQWTPEERESEAMRMATEEARTGFDLSRGPLLRIKVLALEAEEHVLLFTMHHIVSDGWSMGILIREVGILYRAYLAGEESPLPELPVQYADFAIWQRQWLRGEVLEAEIEYWRRQLAGIERLELPTDRPRPAAPTHQGAKHYFTIEGEVADRLRALSQREGVTLFMTLLGAFDALMGRYSGRSEVALGTDIANRNRAEIEGLIGFFVNQLVLRVEVVAGESFAGLLKRARNVCLGAYAHQDMPFEKLVEELQPERSLSRSPFFQAKLVLQNAPGETLELEGLSLVNAGDGDSRMAHLDLTVALTDAGRQLGGMAEYSTDLFDEGTIERLMSHYGNLLRAILEHGERPISELKLLSAGEMAQIVVEWNRTEGRDSDERPIHELLSEQAEQRPERIAVVDEVDQMSYGELNRRSNQLARYMQKLGVGPEVMVGVCLKRSVQLATAILGTLKAGGGYLPLDASNPLERLSYLLEDSGAGLILTESELEERLPAFMGRTVVIDAEWEAIAEECEEPESGACAENLAYVIYTSGSTGKPKGVMIAHRGVRNLVAAQTEIFPMTPQSRVLQFASAGFDASVWEIFHTLASGASLHLHDRLMPGGELERVLTDEAITTVTLPPSVLAVLRPDEFRDLETVISAGEACSAEIVERWARGRRFINAYGPTEGTVCASVGECQAGSGRRPSIGRPIRNTKLYVLDIERTPTPIGVKGELHLAGAGLARGYRGRPEQTAERFQPNPWSEAGGERLYRTGDMVRYLPNGEIDFIGRDDEQVKVRGHRIELGEIEARLAESAEVREAVVALARDDGEAGKRLVAYYTGREVGAEALRAHLSSSLPEYMIPTAYVHLESLPLTPNGKLDRRALAGLKVNRSEEREGQVAPRTVIEEILVGIFQEVLKSDRVGVNDIFFEIGGHSLLATQVISRIAGVFGVEIGVKSVFEWPTVEGLASRVEIAIRRGEKVEAPPLVRMSREGRAPLSYAQQRLWFVEQLDPGNGAYNIVGGVKLRGRLELKALEYAINEVVRRHEVLRTWIEVDAGEPAQVIDRWEPRRLERMDLTGLALEKREEEARRIAREEAGTGFDLGRGPLLRVKVLKLEEEEHLLLYTLHHIVSDGWSMGILIREVSTLYRAYIAEEPSPLGELPIQYADFAVWQRGWLKGAALKREIEYWRKQLTGFEPLDLPTDHPRPVRSNHRGGVVAFFLSVEAMTRLVALSRREGATLFMSLLAAFKVVLHWYTGLDDIVVGTDVANRNRSETENLIGFFVNQLTLRTDLKGNPTFRELVGRVREVALGAYAHQDLPFEKVVEALRPERSLNRTPLFQVKVLMDNTPMEELTLPGLELEMFNAAGDTSRFDLTLTMAYTPEGLRCVFDYDMDLFDTSIARMSSHFKTLLGHVATTPDATLKDLREKLDEADEEQWDLKEKELAEAGLSTFKTGRRRIITQPV